MGMGMENQCTSLRFWVCNFKNKLFKQGKVTGKNFAGISKESDNPNQ